MNQYKLTKESQRCDHGLYFGTTCEPCRLRALLERALLPIKGAVKEWKAPSDRELLADIRKELGK